MARDYLLAARDDPEIEVKIRESGPKDLIEASMKALRLEMSRKVSRRNDKFEPQITKSGKNVLAVQNADSDTGWAVFSQIFRRT